MASCSPSTNTCSIQSTRCPRAFKNEYSQVKTIALVQPWTTEVFVMSRPATQAPTWAADGESGATHHGTKEGRIDRAKLGHDSKTEGQELNDESVSELDEGDLR